MSANFESIAGLQGVTGLCHHRGGIILWQRLPDTLTKDQAAALCAAVSRAFVTYHSAERTLLEAYLEFPAHSVLVIARPPSTDGEPPREFLTIMLTDRAAAADAANAGGLFWGSE